MTSNNASGNSWHVDDFATSMKDYIEKNYKPELYKVLNEVTGSKNATQAIISRQDTGPDNKPIMLLTTAINDTHSETTVEIITVLCRVSRHDKYIQRGTAVRLGDSYTTQLKVKEYDLTKESSKQLPFIHETHTVTYISEQDAVSQYPELFL